MNEAVSNGYNSEADEEERKHANGLRAFATLGTFLEEDGWHAQRIEDKFAYRAYYYGRNGEIRCYAQIRVDLQQFIFYAVATFRVAEEVRPQVAEYITRANFGLRIGNFEMDYSDGEVRYKCGLDFEGETLTPSLIKYNSYPAVQTMDHYLPGLLKVAFGGQSPVEAIAEVEGRNAQS
jgi:hypothetical protein